MCAFYINATSTPTPKNDIRPHSPTFSDSRLPVTDVEGQRLSFLKASWPTALCICGLVMSQRVLSRPDQPAISIFASARDIHRTAFLAQGLVFSLSEPARVAAWGNVDGDDHGRPHLEAAIWGKSVQCAAIRHSRRMPMRCATIRRSAWRPVRRRG